MPAMPAVPVIPSLPKVTLPSDNPPPGGSSSAPAARTALSTDTAAPAVQKSPALLPAQDVNKPALVPVRDSIVINDTDNLAVHQAKSISIATNTAAPGSHSPSLISTGSRRPSNASTTEKPVFSDQTTQLPLPVAPEPLLVLPSQRHKGIRSHYLSDDDDEDMPNTVDNTQKSLSPAGSKSPLVAPKPVSHEIESQLDKLSISSPTTRLSASSQISPVPSPQIVEKDQSVAHPYSSFLAEEPSGPPHRVPSANLPFTSSQFDNYMQDITKRAQKVNSEISDSQRSSPIKPKPSTPEVPEVYSTPEPQCDVKEQLPLHPTAQAVKEKTISPASVQDVKVTSPMPAYDPKEKAVSQASDFKEEILPQPTTVKEKDLPKDATFDETSHVLKSQKSHSEEDNSFDDDIYEYYADEASDEEDLYKSSHDDASNNPQLLAKSQPVLIEPSSSSVVKTASIEKPVETKADEDDAYSFKSAISSREPVSSLINSSAGLVARPHAAAQSDSSTAKEIDTAQKYSGSAVTPTLVSKPFETTAPLAKSPIIPRELSPDQFATPTMGSTASLISKSPELKTQSTANTWDEKVTPAFTSTSLNPQTYNTATAPLAKSPRASPAPFTAISQSSATGFFSSFPTEAVPEKATPTNNTSSFDQWRPVPEATKAGGYKSHVKTPESSGSEKSFSEAVPSIQVQTPGTAERGQFVESNDGLDTNKQQTALEKDIMKSFSASRSSPARVSTPPSLSFAAENNKSTAEYDVPSSPAVPDPEIAALYRDTSHFLTRPFSQVVDDFPSTQPLSPQRSLEPSSTVGEIVAKETEYYTSLEAGNDKNELEPVSSNSSWDSHNSTSVKDDLHQDDSITMPKNPSRAVAEEEGERSRSASPVSDISPVTSNSEPKPEPVKFKSLILDDADIAPTTSNDSKASSPSKYDYLARSGTTATTIVNHFNKPLPPTKLSPPPAFDFRAILTKPRSEDRKKAFDDAREREVSYDCGLETWLQQVAERTGTTQPMMYKASTITPKASQHVRKSSTGFSPTFSSSLKPSTLVPSSLKQGIAGKLHIGRVGEKSTSAAKGLFARGKKLMKSDK